MICKHLSTSNLLICRYKYGIHGIFSGSGRQHGFTSREGLETSNNFSQRKTVRGKSKLRNESHDCNECDELIQKATSLALRDIASAAEIFIKLLLIEQYPSQHHDVIKTCINKMIHFLAENDPTGMYLFDKLF